MDCDYSFTWEIRTEVLRGNGASCPNLLPNGWEKWILSKEYIGFLYILSVTFTEVNVKLNLFQNNWTKLVSYHKTHCKLQLGEEICNTKLRKDEQSQKEFLSLYNEKVMEAFI